MTTYRHYESWADVPPHTYLTKTQLADLDLPRRPGAVAASVEGYDFRGRKDVIELYRIDESTPSAASARALAAARARTGGPDPRLCTDCGAHPDLSCGVYQDGSRLCQACAHIRVIRAAQSASCTEHVREAGAALLRDKTTTIVHCELTDRGLTPGGARRSPAAIRIVALDTTGKQLLDLVVRLVGKRAAGIPADAISLEDAAPLLRDAFTGRVRLLWGGTPLAPLHQALHQAGYIDVLPSGYGVSRDLQSLTVQWRRDIDPRTRSPKFLTPPGRADRMLYLLQQIAADVPAGSEGTSS